MNQQRITMIGGAGKMGTALIDGLLKSGTVSNDQLTATARHESSLLHLRDRDIATTTDNAAAVDGSDKHPAAFKDEVTTPGGCTIDGIAKLQERGISIALIDAVEVSSRKAGLLWDEG
ncbi:MAG: NAD(P)-binding domain-containing protein [bacterium]|nr:NAD(P)-binding domain-containing protein [bacterium]